MGSKYIWIIASVAYGLLSGLIYAFIARRRGRNGFMRRFVVWSAIYALAGLIICRILWIFFAD